MFPHEGAVFRFSIGRGQQFPRRVQAWIWTPGQNWAWFSLFMQDRYSRDPRTMLPGMVETTM
jgi:hypothetical protein